MASTSSDEEMRDVNDTEAVPPETPEAPTPSGIRAPVKRTGKQQAHTNPVEDPNDTSTIVKVDGCW